MNLLLFRAPYLLLCNVPRLTPLFFFSEHCHWFTLAPTVREYWICENTCLWLLPPLATRTPPHSRPPPLIFTKM
jgi:hypothetical protein